MQSICSGVTVGLGDGLAVGVALGGAVAVADGGGVSDGVGLAVALGALVTERVGVKLGATVGGGVGEAVGGWVAEAVGVAVAALPPLLEPQALATAPMPSTPRRCSAWRRLTGSIIVSSMCAAPAARKHGPPGVGRAYQV